ncbi:MAG: NTP transferase domain-containing protein [Rikenellaceae bacterium]|nr:NTP transferase domain-containing protein [Rikenellaceae bacterium]
MDKNLYLVIMAGGVGSRFWPVSRQSMPKQFLDILGTSKSFIRHTYERFAESVPASNVLVVTNSAYADLVAEHLPELSREQILCEPIGRNTAPCIAYAAFRLAALNPEATMIVTPADHLILNEKEFASNIAECVEFARTNDALMTLGIVPSRPDTGYGYIQVSNRNGISAVKTFTEKPNLQLAESFVASGEFVWNSGIFVWRNNTIMRELKNYLPEAYNLFRAEAEHFATPAEAEAIARIYPQCKSISIDYGVLEHSSQVYVRCCDFGWSDLGTWASLYQNSDKDAEGNVADRGVMLSNTKGCIVRKPAEKLAVVDGLDDYIVIDTDDVLLVYPKSKEQEIKQITNRLQFEGGEKYL